MTTRLVLGAGVALLGGLGLVVALAGLYRGQLALAPFGLLGLVLLGAGLATLGRRSAVASRPPAGGYRFEGSVGGPTGAFGFGTDVSGYDDRSGRPDGPACDGGSGGGWSGGGDGGGSSGGGDGGGWSGGGGGGGN
ncbi:hypothetical protein [Micromonospora sp. RTP1Z1]|uniref:hypothetical protein n=1 Tax=Micromonospora sp. RTP1Z1 TaxID=2994043 RepID=UPI0029C9086B|nr:hypothetical protein [Micromonospora sp. RTP1Z1]